MSHPVYLHMLVHNLSPTGWVPMFLSMSIQKVYKICPTLSGGPTIALLGLANPWRRRDHDLGANCWLLYIVAWLIMFKYFAKLDHH